MSEKRKFWQFHLTTALLVSGMMGVLLLLNCRSRVFGPEDFATYGWPLPFYYELQNKNIFGDTAVIENVFTDVILNLSILTNVAFVSEWLIRRREARKT